MSTTTVTPALRIRPENANHHLWNNHGTWFLHYTVHPTPFTKERVRCSLGTKDLTTARARRDTYLARLAADAADPAQTTRLPIANRLAAECGGITRDATAA